MDEVSARPPSVLEVATTIAREAGLPPPSTSLPYPLAMGIGHVIATAFVLAKAANPPPITPSVVKLMTRDVVYDASKAVRLLGWKPRCRALDGIARFAREAAGQSVKGGASLPHFVAYSSVCSCSSARAANPAAMPATRAPRRPGRR